MAKRKSKLFERVFWGFAIFFGTLVTAMLSFVSLELAVLSFCTFSFGAMVMTETRRRNMWEMAASFKFKALKDTQGKLSKEVVLNSKDLADVKKDLIHIRADIQGLKDKAAPSGSQKRAPSPLPPAFEMDVPAEPPPLSALKPRAFAEHLQNTQNAQDDLEEFSDAVIRELLRHTLSQKRVDVFVQPIVRLPQRQTRFYEMFARVRARPGQYIPASRYMQVAEQDNMDEQLDTLLLLHCLKTIQASAHIERAAPFFINIKDSTLTHKGFMQRLLGFVSKNRELAPRMIFEMRQSDYAALSQPHLEILRGLGKLGCGLSLDHVQDFSFNIADLQQHKVRFVKLGADRLSGVLQGEKSFADIHRTKRKLESNGIGVIATMIENEETMKNLADFDIHYGQGYLFGKPELEGAYKSRARARRKGLQEDVA